MDFQDIRGALPHALSPTGSGDTSFEEQRCLLSMLLSDPAAFATCKPYIDIDHYAAKLRRPVKFIVEYEQEHGLLPSSEQVEAFTKVAIPKHSEPSMHTQALVKCYDQFARYKAMSNAVLGGIDQLDAGKPLAVLEAVQAAADLRVGAEDDGGFPGLWIDECASVDPPEYLIKPWLVADTVTALYGAPGSFKSFFALEAAYRLMTGTPFAGQPVKRCQVVYIAAEGTGGIALRIEALRERHGLAVNRTDMRIITQPINLLDPESVSRLIAYLVKMQRMHGIKIGLVVIDTYSQCTAGAEESSTGVGSLGAANMIRIRRELGTTVLFVHHTGKDASRGMRGADALRANTDGAVLLARVDQDSMQATAHVLRAKDAPGGASINFEMEVQPVARLKGRDIDASLVVSFPTNEGAIGKLPAITRLRDQKTLRDIWQALPESGSVSLGKLATQIGMHDNRTYKQKLADLLPEAEPVEVMGPEGVHGTLVREVTGAAGTWGSVRRVTP